MQSNSEARIIGLIGDVYAAALDASRWPGVLQNTASVVGSPVGTVWMHDFADSSANFDHGNGNVTAFMGFDDASISSFAAHYGGVNVWTAEEDRLPSGSAVTGSMLYPDSGLKRTEFYSGWLKPQDLFYTLGSIVVKEETRAVKLSFLRSESSGAYGEEELHVMRQLMPHLQTAVALHRKVHRLQALASSALGALDYVRFGVILLTERGTVMHANRPAHEIANKTAAIGFGPGGTLQGATSSATKKLQHLIRDAALTGMGKGSLPGGALQLPSGNGSSLKVFVVPMPAQAQPFGQHVAAAIFCSDPDAAVRGLAQLLQAIYRMTPAEAALTEALVNGQSLNEFAVQRCTTLNTVRTQLKSAAAKAGAKRQVDLVRMVLTGPAILNFSPVDR